MITIVPLGNIGEEYALTRHNVGWIMLERYCAEKNFSDTIFSRAYSGAYTEGAVDGVPVRVLYPHTLMNNSGVAVKKILNEGDGESGSLIVVHDDVDLPFGTVRVHVGRGAGGHNGVRSIIDTLGNKEFIRVRIGVGKKTLFGTLIRPTGDALSSFVLGTFSSKEQQMFGAIHERVCQALDLILAHGAPHAMGVVNAD